MTDAIPVVTDLRPGVAVEVCPGIRRVVAPNAGVMTGPGTNSYILGDSRAVVVDPGPADAEHLQALLAATAGRVSAVVVTHTHRDHSPGAAPLAAATGANLVGLAAPEDASHDASFVPDLQPADGQWLPLGELRLRAIFTPGHASNHVCWLTEQDILFTGDHVMQGSTVVIPPPDGNMRAYLESLAKIRASEPRALAPGHGVLMPDSDRAIRRLIRHRLQREARVLDRLRVLGAATLDELLPRVYSDVPASRHPIARYSLLAHLLKLNEDGRVERGGQRWTATGES